MNPVDVSMDLDAVVAALAPIGLPELDSVAALQHRTERKYVLSLDETAELLRRMLDELRSLEIEGRRTFGYESIYFDTPDRRFHREAATGRRARSKVRTRSYTDADATMLEVKAKNHRNETVKHRAPLRSIDPAVFDGDDIDFVDRLLHERGLAATLEPVLRTGYRRTTLLHTGDGARLTIDRDLSFADPTGHRIEAAGIVVVETKAGPGATQVDRALWSLGHRPVGMSKFGVGMVLLDPSLPSNKWHRLIRRRFDPAFERSVLT